MNATPEETEAPYPPEIDYRVEGRESFGWTPLTPLKSSEKAARMAMSRVHARIPGIQRRIIEKRTTYRVITCDPEEQGP